jgi:hypothetical protein
VLRPVDLVRTDFSEERVASIIRVIRISELEALAVTWWWRRYVRLRCLVLQEPHSVTFQKTAFYIVTSMKTSNLTSSFLARRFFSSWWWRRYVPSKHQFFQELHGVTYEEKAFFSKLIAFKNREFISWRLEWSEKASATQKKVWRA